MQLLSGFELARSPAELARSRLHPGQPHYALNPSLLPRPLQSVPRWVYALLQGPLLASHLTSHLASKAPLSRRAPISALSADERTWLHALYRRLPAPDLCLAILPSLTGYPPDAKLGSASADDTLGIPSSGGENSGVTRRLVRLPLTWEALHSSGSRLFVLDAYAVAPECTGSHLSASDGT